MTDEEKQELKEKLDDLQLQIQVIAEKVATLSTSLGNSNPPDPPPPPPQN